MLTGKPNEAEAEHWLFVFLLQGTTLYSPSRQSVGEAGGLGHCRKGGVWSGVVVGGGGGGICSRLGLITSGSVLRALLST